MPTITFIDPQGQRYDIEVRTGETLMMAALRKGVPGILAECGGACSCGTCHVYVDRARAGPPGPIEKMILSSVSDLQAELDTLFTEQNRSDDATSIPATFLRVTVKR